MYLAPQIWSKVLLWDHSSFYRFYKRSCKIVKVEYCLEDCKMIHKYIHTYIIGHLNPSVRIMAKLVVCINFIHEWPTVYRRLRTTDFLINFFTAGLFSLRVFARNLVRGNRRRKIFFQTSFWCMTWHTNPGFTSNNPIPTIDHGVFIISKYMNCQLRLLH